MNGDGPSVMKKILYLMGIDWYWIKQRPQFLALELNKDYNVTVVYLSEVFKHISLRQEKDELSNCKRVAAIPYRDKNKVAFLIEKFLIRMSIGNINTYDLVWICHPNLYKYIANNYKGKIVYDCMDDHIALCNDKIIKKEIKKNESQLIKKADVIFASSQFLKEKMEKMGGNEKINLCRNGFDYKIIQEPKKAEKKNRYIIGYIGTIAEWLDFSLIQDSLQMNSKIEYHFIGPLSVDYDFQESNIVHEGVVEHSELHNKVKEYDALIMPFVINDVVIAVDPVKLYEYISMGKCVISVWYKEIDRFKPYVYFYKNKQEYEDLINELCSRGFPPKYNKVQQKEFLGNNTWQKRYSEILGKI